MLLKCVLLLPFLVPGQALENGQSNLQPAKEYRVACELSQAETDQAFQAPLVRLFAGQKASIQDQTQTPFVTDLIDKNGVAQPVVEVFSEGFAIDLRVRDTADGKILLQVTARHSEIRNVDDVQLADGPQTSDGHTPAIQCPDVDEKSGRVSRVLSDGESTKIKFAGGRQDTLKVRRVK